MSNNNVVPSNFDVYPENLDMENAVSMNSISWEEPKQDPSLFMLSNNQLVNVLTNAANNTNNAEGLKMFQGCLEDPIAGDSMCFLPKPEPVNYKFQNRHSWANVSGDQVVISQYNKDNELNAQANNLSKRGMEYLKASNDELLLQPLCDVYDCENKPKDDPNCRVLNCMKCKKQ